MNLFDSVNALDADRILAVAHLERAKDGQSWVCPKCGNGSKGGRLGKGDGIKPTLYNGRLIWHCYACDAHMTNCDLIAAVLETSDNAELARRLELTFPELKDESQSIFFLRGQKSIRPDVSAGAGTTFADTEAKYMASENIHEQKPKDYEASGFYPKCRKRLRGFLESQGGKYRGLDEKTLNAAGVGFADNFMGGQFVIVPYDKTRCFARKVSGSDELPDKTFTKGVERRMYVAAPLKSGVVSTWTTADGKTVDVHAVNFCTEGELDALSIKQALGKYLDGGVVALGGAGRVRDFFNEIELTYGDADEKPAFIFVADNERRGLDAGEKFCEIGRQLGYPCESFAFDVQVGTYDQLNADGTVEGQREVLKVDANSYLQEHKDGALLEFLLNKIEVKEKSLGEQRDAFRKKKVEAAPPESPTADLAPTAPPEPTETFSFLTDETKDVAAQKHEVNSVAEKLGIKSYTEAEYFGAAFDSDLARLEKFSGRLSGFDRLDEKQCWLPGLYTVGAQPGAGKTTFCWQLLKQFAEHGEKCVFCSYELKEVELFTKTLARELHRKKLAGEDVVTLSSADIRLGGWRSADVLALRRKFLSSPPNLRFFDLGDKLVKLSDLLELLDAEAQLSGKPIICAVDYLQLIPVENSRATAKEKVDEIMLRLKTFQKSVDAIIFLISSLNRAGYQNGKTKDATSDDDLTIFKESGMIEFSSDVIWKLTTNKVPKSGSPRSVVLTCSKNRHGSTFKTGFEYFAQFDYFRSCDLKQDEVKTPTPTTTKNDR